MQKMELIEILIKKIDKRNHLEVIINYVGWGLHCKKVLCLSYLVTRDRIRRFVIF